jgi:DNA-binding CsgD family transcriptional regulator
MRASDRPDDLTPREREVFDLLHLGLTNEEIAERLGISLDGAKYHVSQILSKLGVATREEATATTLAEQRGRWWMMLPLTAKAAGAAIVLAAVGGLGLLAWGVLTTSDGTEADTDGPLTVADGPFIGDHWHATYQFFACGEKQPNAPVWESGVHTHGDGILHIHPFQTFEEGAGARLIKWFEYGGGLLTDSEIKSPGSQKTSQNGDLCPDGEPGELQVFVTSVASESAEQRLASDALQQYIPHDGDRIRVVFGPPEEPVINTPRPEGVEPTLPPTPP